MKRLILAIIAGFVVIFGTDFLIHGVWLAPDYQATQAVWRSDAEMQARFSWLLTAQFLCAATFVIVWAMGFASRGTLGLALGFGLLMGLFQQVWALVDYAVIPMPMEIAMKWFFSGLVQALLLGLVTFLIYKPTTAASV